MKTNKDSHSLVSKTVPLLAMTLASQALLSTHSTMKEAMHESVKGEQLPIRLPEATHPTALSSMAVPVVLIWLVRHLLTLKPLQVPFQAHHPG